MWENLYTVKSNGYISMNILVLIIIIIFLVPFMFRVSNSVIINKKKLLKNTIIMEFFLILFCIVVIYSQYSDYSNTVGKYIRGEYSTIEGYVSNYQENVDDYRGDDESFEIKGVKFAYRDMSTRMGYHRTQKQGGVIKGDNQYLKIYYVYSETEVVGQYTNIILRIDERK